MTTLSIRACVRKVVEKPWLFVRMRSLAKLFELEGLPSISLRNLANMCEQDYDLRTAFLEIDRMEGTVFPPSSILLNNIENTVQDIYLQAGIILDIRLEEKETVPDLAGGGWLLYRWRVTQFDDAP